MNKGYQIITRFDVHTNTYAYMIRPWGGVEISHSAAGFDSRAEARMAGEELIDSWLEDAYTDSIEGHNGAAPEFVATLFDFSEGHYWTRALYSLKEREECIRDYQRVYGNDSMKQLVVAGVNDGIVLTY